MNLKRFEEMNSDDWIKFLDLDSKWQFEGMSPDEIVQEMIQNGKFLSFEQAHSVKEADYE